MSNRDQNVASFTPLATGINAVFCGEDRLVRVPVLGVAVCEDGMGFVTFDRYGHLYPANAQDNGTFLGYELGGQERDWSEEIEERKQWAQKMEEVSHG